MGEAAGPIPALSVEALGPIRSLCLARPSVMAYAAERETYVDAVQSVLSMMAQGIIAPLVATYPLSDAANAQATLESGNSVGAIVLHL